MQIDDSLIWLGLPADITRRWAARLREPQRHYHTLDHIEAMLTALPQSKASREIVAAIWLHDIVYDPKAEDNEEQSAQIARKDLADTTLDVSLVVELILGTKRHEAAAEAQQLFNDLDLSILGAAPGIYARYAHQIRMEYAHVSTKAYQAARAQLLLCFDRRDIYQTESFAHLEAQAHRNIRGELAKLGMSFPLAST